MLCSAELGSFFACCYFGARRSSVLAYFPLKLMELQKYFFFADTGLDEQPVLSVQTHLARSCGKPFLNPFQGLLLSDVVFSSVRLSSKVPLKEASQPGPGSLPSLWISSVESLLMLSLLLNNRGSLT